MESGQKEFNMQIWEPKNLQDLQEKINDYRGKMNLSLQLIKVSDLICKCRSKENYYIYDDSPGRFPTSNELLKFDWEIGLRLKRRGELSIFYPYKDTDFKIIDDLSFIFKFEKYKLVVFAC